MELHPSSDVTFVTWKKNPSNEKTSEDFWEESSLKGGAVEKTLDDSRGVS